MTNLWYNMIWYDILGASIEFEIEFKVSLKVTLHCWTLAKGSEFAWLWYFLWQALCDCEWLGVLGSSCSSEVWNWIWATKGLKGCCLLPVAAAFIANVCYCWMCVRASMCVVVYKWVWGCACLRLYLVYVALGIYLPTVRHSQPNWENFVTPRSKKKKRKKWEKMKEKLASTYIWGIARGEFVKRTLLGDNSIELGTSVVPCTPSLPHFGPFFLHVSRVGSSKLKSGNGSDKITHTHACIWFLPARPGSKGSLRSLVLFSLFPGTFFLAARAAVCYLLSNSRDCSIIWQIWL